MKLKSVVLFGISFFLGANLCLAGAVADGQSNTVFQLGIFNRSSMEFADGSPDKPVDFIVGQSSPAKNWYATQPAAISTEKNPANGYAPWAIHFRLRNAPAAAYQLKIALLLETAGVPALRVTINGRHGTFYLHPRLDWTSGDQTGAFSPIYSHADIAFAFAGSYLQPGVNTITLQAIEQEENHVPGIGLTYDAIELDRESGGFHSQPTSARIVPSIFYQRHNGELDELVDVFVRFHSHVKPGAKVELAIAGKRYAQTTQQTGDFGEEKFEFAVPEFSTHTRAQLQWNMNGHRSRQEESIDPAKKWTLFLVPHIHLDVGYSDYQAKIAAIQSRVIGEALDFTAAHPDFRFSLDGIWPLEQFLKTRTPAEQKRAIAAIENRQLFLPAQYANLLTGFPTAETLIRSLYPSANFSRLHGTPFNYANITDVPSFSWSYASILAAAGIHELFSGSNNYRAPVLLQGRLNENSPMWWEGPDGQKVLLWYSRHYMQMQFLFGLPPLVAAGHETLPIFLQQYEQPTYRANAAIFFGTQVENTDLFPGQAELAQHWNSVYEYPHLQYSGFHAALGNIAQQFGNAIPTIRGDGGPYWEDGIASDARFAAIERQNESRGPSAEKLATLTSLINPRLAADTKDLNHMWTYMVLMDEHTFTSFNSVDDPTSREAVVQLHVKNLYAVNAQELGGFLRRNSMASIADSISTGPGSLIIFNTLNWKRSAPVSVDVNDRQSQIVDKATGEVVPLEVLGHGKDFHRVRFLATDIPALGYKVFLLRGTLNPPAPPTVEHRTVLETPYYRVTLDRQTGAVRSIYDKQLQRELVNQQSPYRFGQYLYVTGGDKTPNSIQQYSPAYPKPELAIHSAHNGSLESVVRTPYGWVARMESMDTNTPAITTEIRLFDQEKKIEFVEDVKKKDVDSKEGVYFAFPFAIAQPRFQYEIQNGVVDPAKDMYAGAGHVWFSVQHWVSVNAKGISATVMPLDSALVTLGDINRGEWPAQFGQRPATVFSYVMNNYWNTNYRAGQGGHFRFRYVITSAPSTNPVHLSRMGWEEATPLEKDIVTTQDKAVTQPRALNGKEESFLELSDPALLLDTWKPAEDGKGTILRFLDLGGATRTVSVETQLVKLKQAWLTDAVERNQKALSLRGNHGFQFTIHPHEIVTVRIE